MQPVRRWIFAYMTRFSNEISGVLPLIQLLSLFAFVSLGVGTVWSYITTNASTQQLARFERQRTLTELMEKINGSGVQFPKLFAQKAEIAEVSAIVDADPSLAPQAEAGLNALLSDPGMLMLYGDLINALISVRKHEH